MFFFLIVEIDRDPSRRKSASKQVISVQQPEDIVSKKLKRSTCSMVYHLHSMEYDSIFAIRLLNSFCLHHFVSEKY